MGREPTKGLLTHSTAHMNTRSAASAVPSRTVGNSQICVLLILGLGFVLVFGYQSEIHRLLLGENATADTNFRNSKHPKLFRPHSSETVESTSGEEKEALAGGNALRSGNVDGLNSSLQSSKQNPDVKNTSFLGVHPEARTGRQPRARRKKKTWRDYKVEAYRPLEDSIDTNTVSSKFSLVIKVLSINNYSSLLRCLNSLSVAEYAGDSVDIHVYIDHFEIEGAADTRRRLLEGNATEAGSLKDNFGEVSKRTESIQGMKEDDNVTEILPKVLDGGNRKSGSDYSPDARVPDRLESGVDAVKPSDWRQIEEKLSDSRKVLKYAESFEWKHGKKVIHYRTSTVGSQGQWVDAWWPSSDDEFALFVEDDAELSPLYYRYVRSLIATYYYQESHFDPSLYGISLQRPQIVPGRDGQALEVGDRTRLFKYQMVGIWGQIFFPKPWKEFRMWYDSKKSHDLKPIVDGLVTTVWYKDYGEKLFTPWFVKFAYSKGYFNLYTNFLRDRVLSVTHRFKRGNLKKYAGCDSDLLWNNGTYDIDLWHMAPNQDIKRYDYCFKEVKVGRFAKVSSDIAWVLESTHTNKQVVMISTLGVPVDLVKNFLCTVRKLGLENYLLFGEDSVLLEELARRGHATFLIDSNPNLEENFEKEVHAISLVLAKGYDVWFSRADTIWVGNPLIVADTEGADVVGFENSQLNLAFLRSTPATILSWSTFKQELSEISANFSKFANWEHARVKFLEKCQQEKVETRNLSQVVFIFWENISQLSSLDNIGSSSEAQVVVLSALILSNSDEIKKSVHQLNLWNLDDDLACATLTC